MALSCVSLSMTACLNATSAREVRRAGAVARAPACRGRRRSRAVIVPTDAHRCHHAGFSDALPGQAEHQRIELRAAERQRDVPILGPDELAAVQSPPPATRRCRRVRAPLFGWPVGWRTGTHDEVWLRRTP
jgi:hypothetical protein